MNAGIAKLSMLQAAMIEALGGVEPSEALIASIRAPAGTSPQQALSIYRRSMQSTWINALRLSYPTIERVVGKAFFAIAAAAFVRSTPSRHGDLDRYGASFGDFLAGLPGARELPYLADLARLEWLIHGLHRRQPEPAFGRADLARIEVNGLADCTLRYTRRTALSESQWPVARIWLAHRDNPEDPDFDDVDDRPDRALICAADPTLVILLDEASWMFFDSIRQGHSLLAALDQAMSLSQEFEFESTFAAALDAGVFALPDT